VLRSRIRFHQIQNIASPIDKFAPMISHRTIINTQETRYQPE
jgi:hypothetical protein